MFTLEGRVAVPAMLNTAEQLKLPEGKSINSIQMKTFS